MMDKAVRGSSILKAGNLPTTGRLLAKIERLQDIHGAPESPPGSAEREHAGQFDAIVNTRQQNYSTVTDLARFRGLSTSVPRAQAV